MHQANFRQFTHGLPYKPRHQQPSMFEIFTWDEPHYQKTYRGSLFTGQNRQGSLNKDRLHLQFNSPSKMPVQHKIKNKLYMYADEDQKEEENQELKVIKKTQNIKTTQQIRAQLQKKQRENKLSPYIPEERRQIQKRKSRIKQFKVYTRDLPDSAFTTYYGKPVFSNYGSGQKSSSCHKKTYNVMPHAGSNRPLNAQTHKTALSKSRDIIEKYVPKKPIYTQTSNQNPNDNQSEYFHVEIKKPDLINTLRFSEEKNELKKSRTPAHNQINRLPHRQWMEKNPTRENFTEKRRKKLRKVKSQKHFLTKKEEYPTIIKRENLKEILDQKKKHDSRLAYKVTQCYPAKDQYYQAACSTKVSRWSQVRAAGIQSPRSDHMADVMYSSQIFK